MQVNLYNLVPRYGNFKGVNRSARTYRAQAKYNYAPASTNRAVSSAVHAAPISSPKDTRCVYKPDGSVFCLPITYSFRDDLKWQNYADYLKDRFDGVPQVNIRIYASSYGAEPNTMALVLRSTFGEDSDRFFKEKIQARDIKQVAIERARKYQQTNVRADDLYNHTRKLFKLSKDEIDKFFKKIVDKNGETHRVLSDYIKNSIEYEVKNILDDIENIDEKIPTIIMARNMWPYVNPDEYEDFAQKLFEKLPDKSIVVLGNFDITGARGYKNSDKFPAALTKAGFQPSLDDFNAIKGENILVYECNK